MSESYSEKSNINQNKSEKKEYRINRDVVKRNLGILGLSLAIVAGANFINSDPTSHPEKAGQYNENVKTIELFENANLRENPSVDNVDGNLIEKLDHDVTVQVTGGTYEKSDGINGDWIYIDKEDLSAAGVDIENDGAWVNTQRADVVEE